MYLVRFVFKVYLYTNLLNLVLFKVFLLMLNNYKKTKKKL